MKYEIFKYQMNSPIGELILTSDEENLIGVYFMNSSERFPKSFARKTAVLARAEEQLELYFAAKLMQFDLPLLYSGTAFQNAVWSELQEIKLGQLRSYGEHASKIQKPKAVRAVGTAIGRNPIGIIIPCHRVIAGSGGIGGFSGGLEAKIWLLKHEGHKVPGSLIGRLASDKGTRYQEE